MGVGAPWVIDHDRQPRAPLALGAQGAPEVGRLPHKPTEPGLAPAAPPTHTDPPPAPGRARHHRPAPTHPSTSLVENLFDRELRAVGDGEARPVLELGWHDAAAEHRGVAVVVDFEQLGRECVATGMSLALLRVDGDPHLNTSGRVLGPRTCPPAQVTSEGSPSENSGILAIHSSMATRSSMRARFDPAQRWMPEPKAM